MRKPKILFLITEDWCFWSHRLSLARAARDAGYQVVIATRVNQHGDSICQEGFKLIPIHLQRGSKNLLREFLAFIEIIKIYLRERPDLVHHVAVKPVLYGSWAARIVGIPAIVNALAGLGSIFIAKDWKASVLRKCIAIAYKKTCLSKNTKVIFQNPDDSSVFLTNRLVSPKQVVLIRGSGADTSIFIPKLEPNGVPIVLLASRMLWDKGIGEYVEAAKMLLSAGVKARFVLVGESDKENPTSISVTQLKTWQGTGIVERWGKRDDMPNVFSQSSVVCLPSYREGLPKVLIEAASCGRPIVTTDVPGCREVVRHGMNGLLVPVRDSQALAAALCVLIENPSLRKSMGVRGREIAVGEFSQEFIARQTLGVYSDLLKSRSVIERNI